MSAALLLWAYALVLATVGPAVLRRASWPDRAPRLAIAAWQALSVSVVLAVVLGGLALVVPTSWASASIADVLEACAMALQARYATPAGAALATGGLALTTLVLGRWAYCSVAELAHGAALRRRHHEMLHVVGRPDPDLGVTLLEHQQPVVYCLAGRPHRIVFTTGATATLDRTQLAAVLAHERAHLRGRHHLAIAGAGALTRAFPRLPVFRHAQQEITALVELLADDNATRSTSRLGLAEAMLNLTAGSTPVGALSAGGSAGARRLRRLLTDHRPLGTIRGTLGLVAAVVLVTLPALVLAAPAATAGPDCCTVEHSPAQMLEDCATTARSVECT